MRKILDLVPLRVMIVIVALLTLFVFSIFGAAIVREFTLEEIGAGLALVAAVYVVVISVAYAVVMSYGLYRRKRERVGK